MNCTDHESQRDISANDSWCNFFYYLRYSEGFIFHRKIFSPLSLKTFRTASFQEFSTQTLLPVLLPQQTIWQLLNSYFHCATFLHLTANNYSTISITIILFILPQDISYFLVKDTNVHKETFKEALKQTTSTWCNKQVWNAK